MSPINMPNFYVGVWAQPMASFPKWKAEGVNLIVGPDRESNTKTSLQVRKACIDNGLFYMDSPADGNDLEALIADPMCLRIMLPDEPDLYAPNYNVDPTGFQKVVDTFIAKWKPLHDQCHGRKKFWINFAGPKVTGGRPAYLGQNQRPFGAVADEVCADWYPINMNTLRYWDQYNASSGESLPVTMVKCLKEFFPGKPAWSYLEVCDQNLDKTSTPNDPKNIGRGPAGAEITKQASDLVAQGVSGIVYFVHRIGGGLPWDPAGAAGATAWDGRNADQAAACKTFALQMNPQIIPTPAIDYQKQIDDLKARMTLLETSAVTDISFKKGI